MEEQNPRWSDRDSPPAAEAELSYLELDEVAGGLARIWLGEGAAVHGPEDAAPAPARG